MPIRKDMFGWPLEPGRPDPLCAAYPLKLPWGKKRPRSKEAESVAILCLSLFFLAFV
jgi:hypothetical protein